jgi:hypothetical protein
LKGGPAGQRIAKFNDLVPRHFKLPGSERRTVGHSQAGE